MSGLDAQVGVGAESTYGTAVAPSRFFPFLSEGIAAQNERIEASGIRAGDVFRRDLDVVPNPKGAAGPLSFEVRDSAFGFWLPHMVGPATTSGSGPHVHTATPDRLAGRSFTLEKGVPLADGNVDRYTFAGGKVASWSLTSAIDGLLTCELQCDFQSEVVSTQDPAAASFADGELFSYVGASIVVDGAEVLVEDVTVSMDNALNTTKWKQGTSQKREPYRQDFGRPEVSFTLDYEGLDDFYAKARSRTREDLFVSLTATWSTGASSLAVLLPALRLDMSGPTVGGRDLVTLDVTGIGHSNGTDPALRLVYTSPDATL